jgi:hypothetical protein
VHRRDRLELVFRLEEVGQVFVSRVECESQDRPEREAGRLVAPVDLHTRWVFFAGFAQPVHARTQYPCKDIAADKLAHASRREDGRDHLAHLVPRVALSVEDPELSRPCPLLLTLVATPQRISSDRAMSSTRRVINNSRATSASFATT